MMPITRSWRGFSLPMTTPKEMRVQAAARPPSRTLENVKSDNFISILNVFQPDEVDRNEILARSEPAPAEQEDGELRDGGGDDDGEADGAVSVVREEGHEKPEPRKQHDVDINDH